MSAKIELSVTRWDLILQTIHHRQLQTDNLKLKEDLKDIETRIDAQLREQSK